MSGFTVINYSNNSVQTVHFIHVPDPYLLSQWYVMIFSSPLHTSIKSKADCVFDVLLQYASLDLDLLTKDNQSALLLSLSSESDLSDECMAAKLISKGCAVNTKHPDTGKTIIIISLCLIFQICNSLGWLSHSVSGMVHQNLMQLFLNLCITRSTRPTSPTRC